MNRKTFMRGMIVVVVSAALVAAFIQGRAELEKEKERDAPVKSLALVSVDTGEAVITIDEENLKKSGIQVAASKTQNATLEERAYVTILPPQDLTDLSSNYVAAKAQVEKAQLTYEIARDEFERLNTLHNAEKNVSDKAFQAGVASFKTEQINLKSAQLALQNVHHSAVQRYGSFLADWLTTNSPKLQRILQQQDVLVQLSMQEDNNANVSAKTIKIQVSDHAFVTGSFVGRAPRIDPRMQSASYFYIATANSLTPGMNLLALMPTKNIVEGVFVPQSAVVWWQGKAWIYVQKKELQFARREIQTDRTVSGGFITHTGLTQNDQIVVEGAQMMLSEELRSQIQVGEEGEKK